MQPFFAKKLQLLEIKDGTSNTIALAEASRAVEWTKPDDIAFQTGPGGYAATALGLPGAKEFGAAFFDGTVRWYPKNIDPQKLQALITPSGGEPVEP
jgi:hypothetical protein